MQSRKPDREKTLKIIGGGLAGSEAAWAAAKMGIPVQLYEMRPQKSTPAHQTGYLAELVCSNSLGSDISSRASGMLKNELREMGSLIIDCAEKTRVPAGGSLAVSREEFAALVTTSLEGTQLISIVREEVTEIPEPPVIIATGPLTSSAMATALQKMLGEESLYFFDALAPIVQADSINMSIAFRASRYERGDNREGDYINCPMNKVQYDEFVSAILSAERIELRDFEKEDFRFFEGCLPIEVIASRGKDSLAYGPMRPVGLHDPHTDKRPHAVVQLRQDNIAGSLFNIVGFQTNLKWSEQKRIIQMIPGLENAEIIRYGQMHRNTFINSPIHLTPAMALKKHPSVFIAGQLSGIEGYAGNAASGLIAGLNAAWMMTGNHPVKLPRETMIGALTHYICEAEAKYFQPMKANFGILPEIIPHIRGKRERYQAYADRGQEILADFLTANDISL